MNNKSRKNDSSQFSNTIRESNNKPIDQPIVKKYDPQMQTKSAWIETKYEDTSPKLASSVPYDILTIVKRPKNCFG